MSEAEFKKVSKQQFIDFIEKYPNKLERDLTAICEPPMRVYYDDSLGDYPDCVVGKVFSGASINVPLHNINGDFYLRDIDVNYIG